MVKSVQDGVRRHAIGPVKDAAGVAPAPDNAGVEREDRVLRKYVVGRDYSAAATTTEFVADGPRSKELSNRDTRAALSRLAFRTANWPAGCDRRLDYFKAEAGHRRIELRGKDGVVVVNDESVRVV